MTKVHNFKSRIYAVPYIETGDEQLDNRDNYLIKCLGSYSLYRSSEAFLTNTKLSRAKDIRLGKFLLQPLEDMVDKHLAETMGYKALAEEYCQETPHTCTMCPRFFPTFAHIFADAETREWFIGMLRHRPKASCMEAFDRQRRMHAEKQLDFTTIADVDI